MKHIPDIPDDNLFAAAVYARHVMLFPDLAETDPEMLADRFVAGLTFGMAEISARKDESQTFDSYQLDLLTRHGKDTLLEERRIRYINSRHAGKLLLNVWRIDEYALEEKYLAGSINKSVYLLERIMGCSPSFLRKLWSLYKPVAHFCAANYILDQDDPAVEIGVWCPKSRHKAEHCPQAWSDSRDFLSLAAFFYDYGTTRVERRTKSMLLDPTETWAVPVRHMLAEDVELSSPLSDKETAILKEYKANSRH